MNRGMNVRDILSKKYRSFPFEGAWAEAFGQPERVGVWFIWGNSGNGKTSFVMQLIKELCRYDRVLFDSLEEGTSLTLQQSIVRFGMSDVGNHLTIVNESVDVLLDRLGRRKSISTIVIDSFQYTQMSYRDYIQLKTRFPEKLFVFLSHANGVRPKGGAAVSVMYDATLKIWVEGYKAFSKGRFIGKTGEYTIWEEGAERYWGKTDKTIEI